MTRSVYSARYRYLLERLGKARDDLGLTQVQLAKKLRKPQSFVSKYERGQRRLDVAELIDVAEALELDPVDLMRDLRKRRGR